MNFIDEAKIQVRAGNGGAGAVSFRREKYVPMGGPDGGEGGRGGSVFLVPDPSINTLLNFRLKKKYLADNGTRGSGAQKNGRKGEDIYLHVPLGTMVRDTEKSILLSDITKQNEPPILICEGGQGGKGNMHFKSSRYQAPQFAQPGKVGESRSLYLELKLLADVAIIGKPNAGKSSLISKVSAARPKIADYPFTTLTPNLGVVKVSDYENFVIADIPGLLEGASQGVGLGTRFLRHLERSRLLIHLVDVADETDPEETYYSIRKELLSFRHSLQDRPEIIVFNKMDAHQNTQPLDSFCAKLEKEQKTYRKISVATGSGVQELMYLCFNQLKKI